MILRGYCGAKGSKDSSPFLKTPKRKNCPRMNEGNPDYKDTLLRATLSSADQNHKRGRRHIASGSPLKDPKGDFEPKGSAIGA